MSAPAVTKPTRYTKRERELAEQYLELNRRCGEGTPEQRIAARNELIRHPVLGRLYRSPLGAR